MTIKPATPLPWNLTDRMSIDANLGSHAFPIASNAAYIVHAANAYPELVAALRDAMTAPRCACNGTGKTMIRGGGAPRGGTESECSCVPTRALLAKLGEG